MMVLAYGVPILSIVGFGSSSYEVASGKIAPEKLGITKEHAKMLAIGGFIQVLLWILILSGYIMQATWRYPLAIFVAGMCFFDLLQAYPQRKKMGDKMFKYVAVLIILLLIVYLKWV
jgi:hypothetical protein